MNLIVLHDNMGKPIYVNSNNITAFYRIDDNLETARTIMHFTGNSNNYIDVVETPRDIENILRGWFK